MQVFTHFDSNLWDQHNKGWRNPGDTNVTALVSPGITDDDMREINRNFPSYRRVSSTFFYDLCEILLSEVKDGQEYLLVSPNYYPPFKVSTKKDAFCRLRKKSSLDDLTQISECVTSLANRVELIKLLGEKNVLDSSLVFGTSDFWIAFFGFQTYLKQTKYFTNVSNSNYYGDLVLSLFYYKSSSFSIEVEA